MRRPRICDNSITAYLLVMALIGAGDAAAQCPPVVQSGRGFTGFRYAEGCYSPGSVRIAPVMWDRDGDGPLPRELVTVCAAATPIPGDPYAAITAWDGDAWSRATTAPTVLVPNSSSDYVDAVVWDGNLVVLCGAIYSGSNRYSNMALLRNDTWTSLPPGPSALTNAQRLVAAAGNLFIAGPGLLLGSSPSNLLRWNGVEWSRVAPDFWRASSEVSAVAEWRGHVYVGGYRNGSEPLRAALTVETETGTQIVGGGMNGAVTHLTVHEDRLIVAGTLTEAGGTSIKRIAAWDGSTWSDMDFPLTSFDFRAMSVVDGRLMVATVAGSHFSVWELTDEGWDEELRVAGGGLANILDVDGAPVIFGSFGYLGGQFAPHVATRRDGVWRALESGTDRAVERILNVGPDQYAIGRFRLIEGVPANCVARRVGDTWSALPPIVDDPGYLLDAIEYQGDLVVAGTHINPHDPALSYITRWDGVEWRPVGAPFWSTWILSLVVKDGNLFGAGGNGIGVLSGNEWMQIAAPFTSSSSTPFRVLERHDDRIVAAGRFTSIGGVSAQNIATWNGATWERLGDGLVGTVYAIASYQGQLLAGGSFTIPGHTGRNLAIWDGNAWRPLLGGANDIVLNMVQLGDRLFIGGRFTRIGPAEFMYGTLYNGRSLRRFDQDTSICTGITDALVDGRDAIVVGGFGTLQGQVSSSIGRLILPCSNDYTCDGNADVQDLVAFLDDMIACTQYPSPCGAYGNADITSDGIVDILDLLDFLDTLSDPCE